MSEYGAILQTNIMELVKCNETVFMVNSFVCLFVSFLLIKICIFFEQMLKILKINDSNWMNSFKKVKWIKPR